MNGFSVYFVAVSYGAPSVCLDGGGRKKYVSPVSSRIIFGKETEGRVVIP